MLTYRMMAGPNSGRPTPSAEQFRRWLRAMAAVSPELAKDISDRAREYTETDRVVDEAAAKFEDRE